MNLLSYDDVTKQIQKKKIKIKHLLLGNGFSLSYDNTIFNYDAFNTYVENSNNELVKGIFRITNTRNFEQIMDQLDITIKIIEEFKGDRILIENIVSASISLKEALIDAVEKLHPAHIFKIKEEESIMCANFLKDYLDSVGKIFTTNYDILLYWVLLRNMRDHNLYFNDGFGEDKLEEDGSISTIEKKPRLYWGKNKGGQNIFYLHGGLLLFNNGAWITKETYDGNNKKFLLERITKRIDRRSYPIFVAGGNSEDKLYQIRHNQYLSFCYEKLSMIEGSLVTFGFNFWENDQHIIDAINEASEPQIRNKLESIYIGVYSKENRQHIEAIRPKFKCRDVNIFNAKSVKIWR